MSIENKLIKRVVELEAVIKKHRHNYLQAMRKKDEEIARLEKGLEIALAKWAAQEAGFEK